MSLTNVFEDDLLDLISTEYPPWHDALQYSFPLRNIEPRAFDAIIGTVLVMAPVALVSYWFWQWMGWL